MIAMKSLLSALVLAAALPAATITVDASASGRYFNSGTFLTGQYGTGWHSGVPGEARSFFVFDLSGVTGTITAATLRLATNPSFSTYISPDPSETFTLFDVSTPLATLTSGGGGFADLGTGTTLGSFVATGALGAQADISLNAAGLTYLNAAIGGNPALGGAITTLTSGASNEIVFNATDASFTRQMLLTTTTAPTVVPEPSTWLMLTLGLAPLLLRRRS